MDSSESISFAMDSTTDSIDVVGHFHHNPKQLGDQGSNQNQPPTIIKKQHRQKRPRTILVNGKKLDYHDEDTISHRLPPDKRFCIVEETLPSSTSSTSGIANNCSPSKSHLSHHHSNCNQEFTASPNASSLATFLSCCSETTTRSATTSTSSSPSSSSSTAAFRDQCETLVENQANNPCPGKKSVLFDKVTIYHFNRSQGFTSVPTEGGATLGMKRTHFLRRKISVDLYEEVRRRSRRQILLKIHIERRKKIERSMQQKAQSGNAEQLDSHASSHASNSPDLSDKPSSSNPQNTIDDDVSNQDQIVKKSDIKVIDVESVGNQDDEDDEDTYSDYSDISDGELESDSYIFVQRPLDVKLRRSLLKASGVGRIDPKEKKECNKIRDSRERGSGCKCVGQCIAEYCECSRLGVKCHVDRASFPCGCNSEGCKNPEGRTEFDKNRVRKHFIEKILETHNQLSSNEDELTATTPPSSTTSEESC